MFTTAVDIVLDNYTKTWIFDDELPTNMHKFSMLKPETDNQTLPCGMPPMEVHQKKIIQSNLINATEMVCEVKKVMRFLNRSLPMYSLFY